MSISEKKPYDPNEVVFDSNLQPRGRSNYELKYKLDETPEEQKVRKIGAKLDLTLACGAIILALGAIIGGVLAITTDFWSKDFAPAVSKVAEHPGVFVVGVLSLGALYTLYRVCKWALDKDSKIDGTYIFALIVTGIALALILGPIAVTHDDWIINSVKDAPRTIVANPDLLIPIGISAFALIGFVNWVIWVFKKELVEEPKKIESATILDQTDLSSPASAGGPGPNGEGVDEPIKTVDYTPPPLEPYTEREVQDIL